MVHFFFHCITCKRKFFSLRRRIKCPRCRKEAKLFGFGDPVDDFEYVS